MKRKFLTLLAIFAMLLGGLAVASPASASGTGGGNNGATSVVTYTDANRLTNGTSSTGPDLSGIPVAQRHTGQSPVGYVGLRAGGSSLYFNDYIVGHSDLVAWFAGTTPTYTTNCYYMGVNRFVGDSAIYNDGTEKWLCEVHQDAECTSCIALPAPLTNFWTDLYDWTSTTTRFITSPYSETFYKWSISPITHNVSVDRLKVH